MAHFSSWVEISLPVSFRGKTWCDGGHVVALLSTWWCLISNIVFQITSGPWEDPQCQYVRLDPVHTNRPKPVDIYKKTSTVLSIARSCRWWDVGCTKALQVPWPHFGHVISWGACWCWRCTLPTREARHTKRKNSSQPNNITNPCLTLWDAFGGGTRSGSFASNRHTQ